MKTWLARAGRELGINHHAGNPGELVAGKHERPAVTVFARHPGVDKDVLELSATAAAHWPHPQAGPPESDPEAHADAKVGGLRVVTAVAAPDVETRPRGHGLRRNDFHEAPHNTETQGARKVDSAPASTTFCKPRHRFEVAARQAGLATARIGV